MKYHYSNSRPGNCVRAPIALRRSSGYGKIIAFARNAHQLRKKGSEKKQRYKIRRRNLSNTLKNNQGRVWAKFEGGTLKVADSGAWDRPRVIYAVAGDH